MQTKTKLKPGIKSGLKSGKTQTFKVGSKPKKDLSFPLDKENFVIITAGIVLIVIGYILMAQNSVDGFVPTIVSPILLFIGYCVLIPYGILKKSKTLKTAETPTVVSETASTITESSTASTSNIKTS